MPTDTFSIAASGDDGRTEQQGTVYPPDGVVSVDTAGSTVAIDRRLAGGTYTVRPALLRWDTSSIPDSATIDSAVLRLWVTAKLDDNNRALSGEWFDWGATIDTTDHTNTAASTAFSTDITGITVDADNDFTLTDAATNINKTGYTHLRLHIDGGAPANSNRVTIALFDHATLAEPRLLVTYTEAAGGRSGRWLRTITARISPQQRGLR